MHRVGIVGRALVVAFVLGALAAGSASAHEFVASKAGTTKGKQLTVQKFQTSSGIFECKKETSEGTVVAGSQKIAIETFKYTECAAFGFGVNVSETEFEFNAEGTVAIKKLVTMEVPLAACEVTIPTTGNSALKSATYKNLTGGKVEVKSLLKSMTYGTTGGSCGEPGKNGEYNGNAEVELAGGTLEWK
jgi:hypothetical protein